MRGNVWPKGLIEFNIEGEIVIPAMDESAVLFNSKFESGNLRQAFKVLQKP